MLVGGILAATIHTLISGAALAASNARKRNIEMTLFGGLLGVR